MMEFISYKTNIKNETGWQRVHPLLNRAVGSVNWQHDLKIPERKLTVLSNGIINELQAIL
ncbi:MAG: heavy metal transport/detoxification protein [Segetibacter sp.]